MRAMVPAWTAFDLRTMFEGCFERGFASTAREVERLTKLLGYARRSYERFAGETAAAWKG